MLTLVNHCSWFDVFVSNQQFTSIEICSFYTLMVWLVPSLSVLYITSTQASLQHQLPHRLEYEQLISKEKIDPEREQISFLGLFSPAEMHARSTANNFVK